MSNRLSLPLTLAAWSVPLLSATASLSITLDFSSFGDNGEWDALHNDAWDGSTTAAEKQAAAENTIQAAADYWEGAFVNSTATLDHTISVDWGAKSGSTLATGGTAFYNPGYSLVNGLLTWDNDGTSSFFVDLTPWEESEWAKSSARSMDLGAGDINIERTFYNAPSGSAARDNADMLTVAIHEIGHALGVLGGYPPYDELDVDSDGDLDLMDGSEIAHSGGHHWLKIAYPESPAAAFPSDGWSIGGDYFPTVLGPSIVSGTRKLVTDADILTVASIHSFDNPDFNPQIIPEVSSAGLLSLALFGVTRRRRRQASDTRLPPKQG